MNKSTVERYRQHLLEIQNELTKTLQLAKQSSQTVSLDQSRIGRISRGDAMQQQAMASSGLLRDKARLLAVKRALQRLDDGGYGECQECFELILEKRLAISPEVELCLGCQSKLEGQK